MDSAEALQIKNAKWCEIDFLFSAEGGFGKQNREHIIQSVESNRHHERSNSSYKGRKYGPVGHILRQTNLKTHFRGSKKQRFSDFHQLFLLSGTFLI